MGLGLVQLTLGGGQVLQRDEGAGIGVDAKRHFGLSVLGIEQMLFGRFARVTIGKGRAERR